MQSYSIKHDKRRRTFVRLIGEIRRALSQALSEEAMSRGLTRADIARDLGKDKSTISKVLNGDTNMTLATLADLAFALDRPVKVSLPSRQAHATNLGAGMTTTTLPSLSGGVGLGQQAHISASVA